MRSYDEYCALAKSLDVVGDRWTLLIVRELALQGPCRYTDLRNGLPGIATNLLAARLRELEQAEIVAREDAPPPIATTLFELTPRGEELRPTLESLTRWGLPLMAEQDPEEAVRSHWLAWAIELMVTDRQPDGPPVTVELRIGDRPITVQADGGTVRTSLGPVEGSDLALVGSPRPVLGVMLGLIELAEARAAGVSYEGDPEALKRFGPDRMVSLGVTGKDE
jgi:DNA-binding HxlR family transcriptional regulator